MPTFLYFPFFVVALKTVYFEAPSTDFHFNLIFFSPEIHAVTSVGFFFFYAALELKFDKKIMEIVISKTKLAFFK